MYAIDLIPKVVINHDFKSCNHKVSRLPGISGELTKPNP